MTDRPTLLVGIGSALIAAGGVFTVAYAQVSGTSFQANSPAFVVSMGVAILGLLTVLRGAQLYWRDKQVSRATNNDASAAEMNAPSSDAGSRSVGSASDHSIVVAGGDIVGGNSKKTNSDKKHDT